MEVRNSADGWPEVRRVACRFVRDRDEGLIIHHHQRRDHDYSSCGFQTVYFLCIYASPRILIHSSLICFLHTQHMLRCMAQKESVHA
jgi:hypothetical protein